MQAAAAEAEKPEKNHREEVNVLFVPQGEIEADQQEFADSDPTVRKK